MTTNFCPVAWTVRSMNGTRMLVNCLLKLLQGFYFVGVKSLFQQVRTTVEEQKP